MSKRKCGTCNECCTQPLISSLHKAAGVPCTHLRESRCGVYDGRPDQCREFVCTWLDGFLPKSQKPSKTKTLVWDTGGALTVLAPVMIPPLTYDYIKRASYAVPVHISQPGRKWTMRNGREVTFVLREAG